MSRKAHGQIRRSQVITTYGPGALIDLPRHSAIVGGLETWPKISDLEEIPELRLTRKLEIMTAVPAPKLFAESCAACHRSARGLAKGRFSITLYLYLQKHYASNASSAWALTSYLESVDSAKRAPTRAAAAAPAPQSSTPQSSTWTSRSSLRPPAAIPNR